MIKICLYINFIRFIIAYNSFGVTSKYSKEFTKSSITIIILLQFQDFIYLKRIFNLYNFYKS